MIELPATCPSPNAMTHGLLDYGFVQRGAASLRVDRLGSRYRNTFRFPPTEPDVTRVMVSRFQRAKRQGIQLEIPLHVSQGIPGTPLVDGAGQSGAAIAVKGLTAGYIVREGFWLTIIEADGTAYLHSAAASVTADGAGDATIQIEPPLRAPFADGDTIELLHPYMQGFVDGEAYEWGVENDRRSNLAVTVEEYQ